MRTSLDLSLFPSHAEVLEGEYGLEPARLGPGPGLGKEAGVGLTACPCLTS